MTNMREHILSYEETSFTPENRLHFGPKILTV